MPTATQVWVTGSRLSFRRSKTMPRLCSITSSSVAVTLLKNHGEVKSVVSLPPFVYAGFEAGKELGFITFYVDGEPIGKVGLAAAEGCAVKQKKKNIFGK